MSATRFSHQVEQIPAKQIMPDENQPRKGDRDRSSLAQSIAARGLMHPPHVLRLRDRAYRVIIGQGRVDALRIDLGWETVPCFVWSEAPPDILGLQLHENLLREDLHILDQAEALHAWMTARSATAKQAAEEFGMRRSHVSELRGLLRIPEEMRSIVRALPEVPPHAALVHLASEPVDTMESALRKITRGAKVVDLKSARRAGKHQSGAVKGGKGDGPRVKVDASDDPCSAPGESEPEESTTVLKEAVSIERHSQSTQAASAENHAVAHVDRSVPTPIICGPTETLDAPAGSREEVGPHGHEEAGDEALIKCWWESYRTYPIRTNDLINIFRASCLDIPCDDGKAHVPTEKNAYHWLNSLTGRLVRGKVVVAVPTAPTRRVYCLVESHNRRLDHEERLYAGGAK